MIRYIAPLVACAAPCASFAIDWDIEVAIAIADAQAAQEAPERSIVVTVRENTPKVVNRETPDGIDWNLPKKDDPRLLGYMEESVESGRPLWISWGFEGCAPCALQKKHAHTDPLVIAKSRAFLCVRVDRDKHAETSRAWKMDNPRMSFPKDVVFFPETRRLEYKSGLVAPVALFEFLDESLNPPDDVL